MMGFGKFAVVSAALVLLSACEFADNAVKPSVTGQPVSGASKTAATTPPAGLGVIHNSDGSITVPPLDNSKPDQPTGTAVGQKVVELKADLAKLQGDLGAQTAKQQQIHADIESNAATYQAITGAISGKLQVGTTPGNPGLVQAWQTAQGNLDAVEADIGQMNGLSNEVAGNAASIAYIQDSVRAAFGVSGAVDEDHRQLRILQDQAAQTNVNVDRLLSQISQDVARQNEFLGTERSNLTSLAGAVARGEFLGSTLASRTIPAPVQPTLPPGAGAANGRPLVVIRFDRPNVNYEQALYQAASKALEVRPNAAFDVVGVAPAGGGQAQAALNGDIARTNADRVVRSLLGMGLPADRISASQSSDPSIQANEVRIFVR
ncbi:MAG TPA: hypothetical protein VMW18_06080 [Candidatus Binatia bacterium]|nr:hypothetical protein [Candidatus Binatia bacterium]